MRCFHVNSATAQAAMPMFCCHCVAFSPALGRSPNFSCHSTYFHERFALTIDKRRARSSCCETFLPLAPCFFFTATKSLHCSSCCGVALNFISCTAVPIFTDDFGQHPHHSPPRTKHSQKCTLFLSQPLQPVTTCNFKPNLARIVLTTHAQDTAGGCGVR